jgi:cytochrome P450
MLDLLDPELAADPYPALARMRECEPVHWSDRHQAWMVFRYDDVTAALADARLSSNRIQPLLASLRPASRARMGRVLEIMADWMVVRDPPQHTRLRRLTAAAFSPRRVKAMEARIGEIVDGLLDAALPRGGMDVVADLAYPLPATVIAELVGAPAEDFPRFRAWSQALGEVAFGAGDPERYARALAGLDEMLAYFHAQVARERAGDDLIGVLLAGDGADALDHDEIAGMCALLLFAGHETTTSLISNAVLTLGRHPRQLARLRAEPALIGTTVEEVLRFEGPVKLIVRWAAQPLELRGRTIEAGTRVQLMLASANRDPARFAAPDAFDISRAPSPHLAFGRGVHACIGAMLARLEARAALAGFLDRVGDYKLEAEPRWTLSRESRALESLRVSWA